MRRHIPLVLVIAVCGLPAAVHGADVRSILDTVRQKQLERWDGVNAYVLNQSIMGNASQTYMRRMEVEDDSGGSQTLFMPVQPGDVSGDCSQTRRLTPEELDAYAAGLEMTGDALASGIEDGLEEAGLPRGLLAASGSDPSATFDPRVMMGAGAGMYRALAEAERDEAAGSDGAADRAAQSADYMAEFMRSARLVGTESIGGRDAFHLEASGLNRVQQMDGREFTLHTVGMWIDAEHYVPLRLKMDGVLKSGTGSQPMTIEQIQSDYRTVPGSSLYEPYNRSMKISGMMDAAQEAQLREAQQQLAEFEKQMAGMPENQRAMMEKMMGPQLDMIRKMASGGGFQADIVVNSITVNPGSCAGQG